MGNSFRLAGLLRFRQAQEDQAAAALARANSRHQAHEDRVDRVRSALTGTPLDPGSAAALRASAAARSSARSMLLELHGVGQTMATDVAAARSELVAARKTAASLEKLSEKHLLEEQHNLLHADQMFLDELSSTRRSGKDATSSMGSERS